jgi:hypothetical protein
MLVTVGGLSGDREGCGFESQSVKRVCSQWMETSHFTSPGSTRIYRISADLRYASGGYQDMFPSLSILRVVKSTQQKLELGLTQASRHKCCACSGLIDDDVSNTHVVIMNTDSGGRRGGCNAIDERLSSVDWEKAWGILRTFGIPASGPTVSTSTDKLCRFFICN